MSAQKTSSAHPVGGPGASHENRKHPEKSRPHGELPHEDAGSGNAATRVQEKILRGPSGETTAFAGQTGAGGDHRPSRPRPEAGHGNTGHTGKDDDPIKPKSRRQVR